jgi:hypothetical protein
MSDFQDDDTASGSERTGLWLQSGFVEGIVADRKRFATLEEAYRHIFRRNLEYAVLLWKGIPVRISYPEDLPMMVSGLIAMLECVQQSSMTSRRSYEFQTPNFHATWQVETTLEMVFLEGAWQRIAGDYEAALNNLGILLMPRLAFLCEWKLLLEQLIAAFSDAEAVLTRPEDRDAFKKLKGIEANIPHRGRFYQYEEPEP